jgi:transcriptional regulator with XRE-family HTH domain
VLFSIFFSEKVTFPEKNTTQSSIWQLLKIEMTSTFILSNLLPMVEPVEKGLPVRHPEFAARVQEGMKRRRVTVRDIQRRLGVSYEMARRYSLGQAMPRPSKIADMAKLLGMDPTELQFGEIAGAFKSSGLRKVEQEPPEDKPSVEEAMEFFNVFQKLNRLDRADTMSFMENLVSISAVDKVGTSNNAK